MGRVCPSTDLHLADGAGEAKPHQVLKSGTEGIEMTQGWTPCILIEGATGSSLVVMWVLVAVRAAVTGAQAQARNIVLLKGMRGWG